MKKKTNMTNQYANADRVHHYADFSAMKLMKKKTNLVKLCNIVILHTPSKL